MDYSQYNSPTSSQRYNTTNTKPKQVLHFLLFAGATFILSFQIAKFLDHHFINVPGDWVVGYGAFMVYLSYVYTAIAAGIVLSKTFRLSYCYGIAAITPVLVNIVYFVLFAPHSFYALTSALDFLGSVPIWDQLFIFYFSSVFFG